MDSVRITFHPLPATQRRSIVKSSTREVPYIALLTLLISVWTCNPKQAIAESEEVESKTNNPDKHAVDKPKWQSLFDGKSLKGWKVTKFGGEGDVTAKEGVLTIEMGTPLSGVTYTKKPLTMNYEIELEAQRVMGSDFFCGLTFPVGKESCSLILGGWGGGLVGISSLDGLDASENDTTGYHTFEDKKWYKVRVRVLPNQILAWLDDKEIVNISTEDRRISVRIEVELAKPLGLSTFQTTGAFRNIRVRPLSKKEIAAASED